MERVDRYAIEGELGRGAMGVVYRAQDPRLDRPVALKLLVHSAAGSVGGQRFRREVKALARLQHPAIVAVRDAGEHRGAPFLVMDLIEGGSLDAELERQGGRLPTERAARIALCLARALQHAHEHQILHRDLKPANVLLDGKGEPQLTDFGLARILHADADSTRISVTGQLLGTPGFWAPEQARGDLRRLGPAADIYGLGATLHAMLTGRPPYTGESLVEVLSAMARPCEPPRALRPDLPADLERIVLRCLDHDPSRRYPTAGALAEDLARFLDARPLAPRRSSRGLALCVLGAALLLGAGLTVALSSASPAPEPTPAGIATPAPEPTPASSAAPAPEPARRSRVSEAADLVARAHELIERGEHEAATELVRRATELDAENALAWRKLGRLQLRSRRLDEARRCFERALALDPEDGVAHRLLGMTLWGEGEREAALAEYRRAVELGPDDFAAHFFLADGLGQLEQLEEASRVGAVALGLKPVTGAGYANRAYLGRIFDDPAGALEDYTTALELGYGPPGLRLERAILLNDAGRPYEAEPELRALLEHLPGEARLHAALAWGCFLRRVYDEAIAHADAALELQPRLATAHAVRGFALARNGQLEPALESIDRGLRIDRSAIGRVGERFRAAVEAAARRETELKAREGLTLGELGRRAYEAADERRFDLAERLYTRLLDVYPDHPLLLSQRARVRLAVEDYAGMVDDLSAALRDEPWNIPDRVLRAQGLFMLDRTDEALADAAHVLARDPDQPDLWAIRAAVHNLREQYEAAYEQATRALELRSDAPNALRVRAAAAEGLDRLDLALRDAERALELEPDLPENHGLRGLVRAQLGDLGGLDDIRRALELRPGDVPLLLNRAAALYYLGRLDASVLAYEELAELAASSPAAVHHGLLPQIERELDRARAALEAR